MISLLMSIVLLSDYNRAVWEQCPKEVPSGFIFFLVFFCFFDDLIQVLLEYVFDQEIEMRARLLVAEEGLLMDFVAGEKKRLEMGKDIDIAIHNVNIIKPQVGFQYLAKDGALDLYMRGSQAGMSIENDTTFFVSEFLNRKRFKLLSLGLWELHRSMFCI